MDNSKKTTSQQQKSQRINRISKRCHENDPGRQAQYVEPITRQFTAKGIIQVVFSLQQNLTLNKHKVRQRQQRETS